MAPQYVLAARFPCSRSGAICDPIMPVCRTSTGRNLDCLGYYTKSSELFVDQAISFLEKRENGRPFFMQVWLNDPHNPYRPTEEQLSAYPDMPPSGRPPLALKAKCKRQKAPNYRA